MAIWPLKNDSSTTSLHSQEFVVDEDAEADEHIDGQMISHQFLQLIQRAHEDVTFYVIYVIINNFQPSYSFLMYFYFLYNGIIYVNLFTLT